MSSLDLSQGGPRTVHSEVIPGGQTILLQHLNFILPSVIAAVQRRRLTCVVDSFQIVAMAADALAIFMQPALSRLAAAQLAARAAEKGPIRPPESAVELMVHAEESRRLCTPPSNSDGIRTARMSPGADAALDGESAVLADYLGRQMEPIIACIRTLHDDEV